MKNKIYGLKYLERKKQDPVMGGLDWRRVIDATQSFILTGEYLTPDQPTDTDVELFGVVFGL